MDYREGLIMWALWVALILFGMVIGVCVGVIMAAPGTWRPKVDEYGYWDDKE